MPLELELLIENRRKSPAQLETLPDMTQESKKKEKKLTALYK